MARDPDRVTQLINPDPFKTDLNWRSGAIAGLNATVIMGGLIWVMNAETLRLAIASLYGFKGSFVVGWVSHLVHGTLFGVVFALVLTDPALYRLSDWVWKTTVAGLVYGLVLAVIAAGIIMPIWLGVTGFVNPPSIPNVTVPMLIWHSAYGITLGSIYAVIQPD